MTGILSPRADPFVDAECRRAGRDPRWWDADASRDLRRVAASLCTACPATAVCETAAVTLGQAASGTWAAIYRPWVEASLVDDETLAEYLAVFGPSAAHNDLTPPKEAASVKYGRYWLHPAQLKLDYQQREAM